MLLLNTAILLAIVPFSMASTCTSFAALSWPLSSNSSLGSGAADACSDPNGSAVTCCAQVAGNNQAALQACLKNAGLKKLMARTTLTCTSSETCYQYYDGSLLCLDEDTGLYHDDIGGTGDYNTGKYTAPDGSMTTDLIGATATPTGATTSSRRTGSSVSSTTLRATSSAGRASTMSPVSSSSTGVTPVSVTTSTRSAGAEGIYSRSRGSAIIGALGLLVRLVL